MKWIVILLLVSANALASDPDVDAIKACIDEVEHQYEDEITSRELALLKAECVLDTPAKEQ